MTRATLGLGMGDGVTALSHWLQRFPVRPLVVDGWRVAQRAGKTGRTPPTDSAWGGGASGGLLPPYRALCCTG